jgi:hypothetical protein
MDDFATAQELNVKNQDGRVGHTGLLQKYRRTPTREYFTLVKDVIGLMPNIALPDVSG